MDREKQREIARKGGRAAHEKGTAHEFTADEARAAGRKGGERVSADKAHMSRIGRLGGKSSAGRRGSSDPSGAAGESSRRSSPTADVEMMRPAEEESEPRRAEHAPPPTSRHGNAHAAPGGV